MVEYDESDLIAKMQQEVDLKKSLVLNFYDEFLQKRHPAFPQAEKLISDLKLEPGNEL